MTKTTSAAEIIFEDKHLVVVNKKAGILVQGDSTGDPCLRNLLMQYYRHQGEIEPFVGVIHRLDRPVSGLTMFARNQQALLEMNQAFRTQKVRKTYWAISEKRPTIEAGRLEHYLTKDHKRNIAHIKKKAGAGAKKAILDYELIARIGRYFLIEVKPQTGRPHQIRVQLQRLGCPIVGDLKYGALKPTPDQSVCLHARVLEFEHPVTAKSMYLKADLPIDVPWSLFREFE